MSNIYGEQHRLLQEEFDTTRLANRLNEVIVQSEITDDHRPFIEGRDMFFLTSIDHRGYPTCSHKGGKPGFVRVVDNKTIAFPSYNGNGMFLSMGNINANNKVGLLFIDFETPHRVRVHGNASIDKADSLLQEFLGAELIVRITVTEVFVNCPRYIHQYKRIKTSKYVPQANCKTPIPQWKRIDAIQDALPELEKDIADKTEGIITIEEYSELLGKGEG